MSTDRQLLEDAARAAGQERSAAGDLWSSARGMLWNPLTDDGDAMRLMVKLGIQVDPRGPETRAFGPVGERVDEYHKPDAFAATRRAIVRAAAEIGKARRLDQEVE